jgi:hypothetical protein
MKALAFPTPPASSSSSDLAKMNGDTRALTAGSVSGVHLQQETPHATSLTNQPPNIELFVILTNTNLLGRDLPPAAAAIRR